jgi:TonB family protein
MAHQFMPEPEPDRPQSRPYFPNPLDEFAKADATPPDFESDLVELTARFSSPEGGHLSAELSSDLALEVVLNEIVEKACLVTGATGATIILQRDGEWVCRARYGRSAPELGDRLRGEASLTAQCIQTGLVQNCADTAIDSRVDAEACQSLGISSVTAIPLFLAKTLVGVFTVFSRYPSAFGEHEQRTLQAFSRSVVGSLARAWRPSTVLRESAPTEVAPEPSPKQARINENVSEENDARDLAQTESEDDAVIGVAELGSGKPRESPRESLLAGNRALNLAKWGLAASVFAFAVLLPVLAGRRLLAVRESSPRLQHLPSAAGTLSSAANIRETSTAQPASTSAHDRILPNGSPNLDPGHGATQGTESVTPEGGLTVYENGKTVFQMSASSAQQAYKLPPGAAQARLIRLVEPVYPQQARDQKVQGSVVLDVDAGQDGFVKEVKIVRGDPLLTEAAIAAVKQWRFKPLLVEGRPKEIQTEVVLNFSLPQ